MKKFLVAAIGALLVVGTFAASAATLSQRTNESVTVPVTTNSVAPADTNNVAPWNADLAHQTGDGSR